MDHADLRIHHSGDVDYRQSDRKVEARSKTPKIRCDGIHPSVETNILCTIMHREFLLLLWNLSSVQLLDSPVCTYPMRIM